MDEPFAALDEITRADMRHLLARLCERPGRRCCSSPTRSPSRSSCRIVSSSCRNVRAAWSASCRSTCPVRGSRRSRTMPSSSARERLGPAPRRRRTQRDGDMTGRRDRRRRSHRKLAARSRPASSGSRWSPSLGSLVRMFDVGSSSCRHRRSCPRSSTIPRFFLDAALVTGRHALVGIMLALVFALADRRGTGHVAVPRAGRPTGADPDPRHAVGRLLRLGRHLARLRHPPVLFLVTLVSFPAFTFATVTGLRSSDPSARELLASVEASRLEVLWRLRLPSALPSLYRGPLQRRPRARRRLLQRGRRADTEGLGGSADGRRLQQRRPAVGSDPVHRPARRDRTRLVTLLERVLLRWHVSQR